MFERFTKSARAAVVSAQEQARSLGHNEIMAEHLLLGVMAEVDGVGAKLLRELGVEREAVLTEVEPLGSSDAEALRGIGVDLEAVRRQAEAAFGPGALDRPMRRRPGLFRSRLVSGHLPFTDASKQVLEQSLREALALKHNYIGSEHILLGLLADVRAPVPGALRRLGVTLDLEALRARVIDELQRAA